VRSLVLALLIIPVGTFAAERATGRVCLHDERVRITEVDGQIELAGRPARIDSIHVRLPVDCKSGEHLIPRNLNEAVEWLDVGLPIDLKAALLHGDYADPFKTSNYGASVMSDLHLYVGKQWKLTRASAVCAAPVVRKRSQPDETPCFYVLVDLLRETYLKGAGIDQK
jgi:hypothetical protein